MVEEEIESFEKSKNRIMSYEITASSINCEGDDYEPNDTKAKAYPYKNVKVITESISFPAQLYTLGMRSASLHSKDDVDWYYVDYKKGDELFVDLRNIGMQNWTIELYYSVDGKGYKTYPKESVFKDKPERYFTFTVKETGRIYIKIYSQGDWSSESYYYFYVGKHKNNEFQIKDMATMGNTKILGTSYSTPYILDLTNAVPADAIINELYLTNDFAGKGCNTLDKKIYTSKKRYTNTSKTGNEKINISSSNNEKLAQVWFICGRCGCSYNTDSGLIWTPRLNATFTCTMGPYPGNEIN